MKRFSVPVSYTFMVVYDIDADTAQQAKEIASNDCGLVLGGNIHTSDEHHVISWDAHLHPDELVGKPTIHQKDSTHE